METDLRHGGPLRVGFRSARLKTLAPMPNGFDDRTKMYLCHTSDVRICYLFAVFF